MRKTGTRIIAILLIIVLVIGMLPMSAMAALIDKTPDQNATILAELTDFGGDEKTAQDAMAMLNEYGLIDTAGNIISDWSGTIDEKRRRRIR